MEENTGGCCSGQAEVVFLELWLAQAGTGLLSLTYGEIRKVLFTLPNHVWDGDPGTRRDLKCKTDKVYRENFIHF